MNPRLIPISCFNVEAIVSQNKRKSYNIVYFQTGGNIGLWLNVGKNCHRPLMLSDNFLDFELVEAYSPQVTSFQMMLPDHPRM